MAEPTVQAKHNHDDQSIAVLPVYATPLTLAEDVNAAIRELDRDGAAVEDIKFIAYSDVTGPWATAFILYYPAGHDSSHTVHVALTANDMETLAAKADTRLRWARTGTSVEVL